MRYLSDVTFVVPTFMRHRLCRRAVASVRRTFPESQIVVCNDGARPFTTRTADVHVITLPHNSGVAAARNALAAAATTPLILFWDDDWIVRRRDAVERLHSAFHEGQAEIVCGRLLHLLFPWRWLDPRWYGDFRRDGDRLRIIRPALASEDQDEPLFVDLAPTFAMMRPGVVTKHPMDESLRNGEHLEWFLRLHGAGIRVLYVPSASVTDIGRLSPYPFRRGYMKERDKAPERRRRALAAMGITDFAFEEADA